MVPDLTVGQLLDLETGTRALRSEGPTNVDKVIELACDMWRQNIMKQNQINNMLRHIAELECRLAVAERDVAPRR